MKYIFLPEDFVALQAKRTQLTEAHREAGKAVGEAAEQDTWHDNFSYDQAVRDLDILSKLLAKITEIANNSQVVEPPAPDDGRVRIGSRVLVKAKTGESWIRVGSYSIAGLTDSRENSVEATTSYVSPMGRALLGAQVGDERSFSVAGNVKTVCVVQVDNRLRP